MNQYKTKFLQNKLKNSFKIIIKNKKKEIIKYNNIQNIFYMVDLQLI